MQTSSLWDKKDKYREELKKQHYILHRGYYYVASFLQFREFNYYNDPLTVKDKLVVTYYPSLSDCPIEFKNDRLLTNITTKNKLWRSIRKRYPNIIHRYNKDLVLAHHDLTGLKETEGLTIDENTRLQIRMGDKHLAEENKYTPSLEALMQLSLTIN